MMSHQLTDKFWESLGPQGLFLCKLFHKQSQLIVQLQTVNNALVDHAMETQDNVLDAAAKAKSSVVQATLSNVSMGGHSSLWGARAAKPEAFDRIREKTEQFFWAIHIMVAMQMDTFMDERKKVL